MNATSITPSAAVPNRGILTACAMAATLMQTLDSTITNVALPYMQGSLAATADQVIWVLTSYIAAAAIMTAPIGWLSARFGRKNLFIVSLAGFTVASMLCGLAQSLTEIVLFRLLQGVFGAALVPLSQATMLDLYPIEQRGPAMALFGIGVVVGPILGPTLGGYLTEFYNWRWVFYINLPLGVLTIGGLWLFLEDTGRDRVVRFDVLGFAALSLGLGALQLMLDQGEQRGWFAATDIVVFAVLCGLGFYLFVVHTFTTSQPLIAPRLFRDMNFSAGLLMIFAVGMLLVSTAALLAPYLQTLAGYSVWEAGLLIAPRGVGTMVGVMLAGRLTNRVDLRLMMLVGLLLIAASLWQMTGWTPDVSVWSLSVISAVQGFGLGLLFTALGVISFYTLPVELRTDGTALFSLVRNVGASIGISVTSVLLTQNIQIMHAQIAETVTPFNRMLQSGAAYLFWNSTTPSGLAALNLEVTRQASIVAYVDDFKFLFLISLAMVPLLLLMRQPHTTGKENTQSVLE